LSLKKGWVHCAEQVWVQSTPAALETEKAEEFVEGEAEEAREQAPAPVARGGAASSSSSSSSSGAVAPAGPAAPGGPATGMNALVHVPTRTCARTVAYIVTH
jgi:hypothetical protein